MNLKHLEAFVHVADQKSFSKAAQKLYLTQPTVTAHVGALEKELGCRLFTRSAKGAWLLPDGERLYPYAKEMLRMEGDIQREFGLSQPHMSSKIVLGASTVPSQYLMPQILAAFSREYPEFQIEMRESDSGGVLEWVEAGEVELGFAGTRQGSRATLAFEAFYTDRLVVVAPNQEKYAHYAQEGFAPGELAQERVLVREAGSGTRMEAERYLRTQGIAPERLRIVAEIGNTEAIKKAVARGMGISILSGATVVEEARSGALLSLPLRGGDIERELYMVWRKGRKQTPAAFTLMEFVRKLRAVGEIG
ncbi:MAG: LysR family transcriptional regulator [Lachnospiraceae bacterium]|nr:LysR family transcriptional regulator [Lachnospiraceae bacterium]